MKVQEVKINRYERVGTPVALSGSFRPHSLRASKNKLTKLSRWSKQWGVLQSNIFFHELNRINPLIS